MDNGVMDTGTGIWKDDQIVFKDEILTGYTEYKNKLDTELKANAEGFVRIGYLLKVARDTNILADSGYKNVAEFAQAEYGLTKDIVSRYIAINDKYAENGYSDKLQSKYEGFGVAKLQEMLTLPDAIIEEIEPTLTKREIVEIKKEVAAEEAITPIEVAIEAADPKVIQEEKELTLTQRIWKDIIKSLWDKYNVKDKNTTLHKIIATEYPFVTDDSFTKPLESALYELIAPSGTATLWARIPGVGRYMVTVKGLDEPINMVNARDGSKINTSFADAVRDIADIFDGECTPESWERVYGLSNPQYEEKKDGKTRGDGDNQRGSRESDDGNAETGRKGSKGEGEVTNSVSAEESGKQSNGRDTGTGETIQETEKDTRADDIRDGAVPEKETEKGEKDVHEASTQPNNMDIQPDDGHDEDNVGEATSTQPEEDFMPKPGSWTYDKPKKENAEGKPKVAPVQLKQLGHLDIGDKVVSTVNGETGTMVGICAGDYKIAIDNGGITLVAKDSIRWTKHIEEAAEEAEKGTEEKPNDNDSKDRTAEETRIKAVNTIRDKAETIGTICQELIHRDYDADDIAKSFEAILEMAEKIKQTVRECLESKGAGEDGND